MKKIKVLTVDDSALVRSLLTEIINQETDTGPVGAGPDPIVALHYPSLKKVQRDGYIA